MYVCMYVHIYVKFRFLYMYIHICCHIYIRKTITANFRLFAGNGNGKQKFDFLGR